MTETRHACGCVTAPDLLSGVLRSISKCSGHLAEQNPVGQLGLAYYERIEAIVGGIPQCAKLARQFAEALGPFPRPLFGGRALEVGCGVSMYAHALIAAGYEYIGVEPDPFGAAWTRSTYDVAVIGERLEAAGLPESHYALIVAAHCVEHMDDAPGAIRLLAATLRPGGELWIVVPDDSDPVNPDHLWIFNQDTLKSCVEVSGLTIERMAMRKYIERENFIYCRARRTQG
jgi:SAM-dependent methyltransferase